MSLYDRGKELLSPRNPFGMPAEEVGPGPEVSLPRESQMILRMMVRTPTSDGMKVPTELDWLKPTILFCDCLQKAQGIHNEFVYITVRHGPVVSKTDDLWHVDGFSMRKPHPPEQNYIWTSCYGTEVLNQRVDLPSDFNPLEHNIHRYFQSQANETNVQVLDTCKLYAIDPYVIHRRPKLPEVWRTFFRISFVPIEIEDDTCTVNPLIPREKPYGREDIRLKLKDYS